MPRLMLFFILSLQTTSSDILLTTGREKKNFDLLDIIYSLQETHIIFRKLGLSAVAAKCLNGPILKCHYDVHMIKYKEKIFVIICSNL